MKKEDIVFLKFDVIANGKKYKAGSAAVVVDVVEKLTSMYVTIFLEGSVIKLSEGYIKSAKVE